MSGEGSCYYLSRNEDETNGTFTIAQDHCDMSSGLQICQGVRDVPVFKVVNVGFTKVEDRSKVKDLILGNPFMSQTMCVSYCQGKSKYAIVEELDCFCYEGAFIFCSSSVQFSNNNRYDSNPDDLSPIVADRIGKTMPCAGNPLQGCSTLTPGHMLVASLTTRSETHSTPI